MVSAMFSVH